MTHQHIIVETTGRVGVIRLNRPQALNALNSALIAELAAAIDAFEADAEIGCIVITGSDKAFAAGADIKEMAGKSYIDAFMGNFAATWDREDRKLSQTPSDIVDQNIFGAKNYARSHDRVGETGRPQSIFDDALAAKIRQG